MYYKIKFVCVEILKGHAEVLLATLILNKGGKRSIFELRDLFGAEKDIFGTFLAGESTKRMLEKSRFLEM